MVVYGKNADFIENLFREVVNASRLNYFSLGKAKYRPSKRIEEEKNGYRLILQNEFACKLSIPESKPLNYKAIAFLLKKYDLVDMLEKYITQKEYRVEYKHGVISITAERPTYRIYEPYMTSNRQPILIGELNVWLLSHDLKKLTLEPLKPSLIYSLKKGDVLLSQIYEGEAKEGVNLWGETIPGAIKGRRLEVKLGKNTPVKKIEKTINHKTKVLYVAEKEGIYLILSCNGSKDDVVLEVIYAPRLEVEALKSTHLPKNSSHTLEFYTNAHLMVGSTDRQIKIKAPNATIYFKEVVTLQEVIAKEIHAGYVNKGGNKKSLTSLEAEEVMLKGDVFYSTIRANSVYFSPQHRCACYHTDLEVNKLEVHNVSFSGVTIKPKDGGFVVIKASNISYKENPVTIINPSFDSEFPFDESKIKVIVDLNRINRPISELKSLINQYIEKYNKIFLTTKDGKTYEIHARNHKEK